MARHYGNVTDLHTESGEQYQFYPISCGSVQFKVRAKNDAHIALTSGPRESNPMYEVFIGGWRNTKSVIRKNKTQPEKAEADTPGILSEGEFRAFWVRWDNGTISVGRDLESNHFLTWTDPDPFAIYYVGVNTGWGSTGSWKIEDTDVLNTPDKLEYIFRPVTAGYVQFEYRGGHSAQVCLSTEPAEVNSMYEFTLGEGNNTQSSIRRSRQNALTKPTPGVVQPNEFRTFLVEWKNGRLLARDALKPTEPLLDWEDRSPFPVAHFGVRSGPGARGHWRIQHYPVAMNQTLPPENDTTVGKWVGVSGGEVPDGAVVGGQDSSGEPLYVIRASHKGALLPGKLLKSKRYAVVPWGGSEYGKSEYQVLVGGSNDWMPTRGDNIPPNALPAGQTEDGEPLYVGRVRHEGALTTGKVQKSHSTCYIPHNGMEVGFPEYEILLV